jgi:phage terminase large subunit-like protein
LEGAKGADNLFCDIYSIDERDSYFDPNVWIKANPYVMTCPEKAETMKTDAQTAKDMGGSELQDFIVKSCNMWATGERERFAQPNDLEACAQEITLEDIRGCHVCLGFDFSSGGDLTTISGVAEFKGGVYIFSHSFMPRARFAEHIKSDLVPYDLWEQTGLITVTGGESDYINDYGFALSYARDLLKEYELKLDAIGIDPHNADGIAGELESFGVPVIRVTQSARFLNDATQELQLLIKGHNVYFDRSNELLKWSMANAIITQNSFGEKKVDKEPNRKTRRIDPVDAAIDAYCAKMKYKKVAEVDQASAIDRYMEIMGFDR